MNVGPTGPKKCTCCMDWLNIYFGNCIFVLLNYDIKNEPLAIIVLPALHAVALLTEVGHPVVV